MRVFIFLSVALGLFGLAITGVVLLAIWISPPNERVEVYLPLRDNAIDEGIRVGSMENKFIVMRRLGLFSGGGAGGLGAPQIVASSSQQFAELVADGETIYVSIETAKLRSGRNDYTAVIRMYWAFIESRAGLLTYSERYEVISWGCNFLRVEGRFTVWYGRMDCRKAAEEQGLRFQVL